MTAREPRIASRIRECRLCAEDFAQTTTAHEPRPVVWFRSSARILIAGQAPGLRVHESGVPFDDRSGDRLRDWMGVTRDEFYDRGNIAVVPMAFCFPGYDAKGSDLPPQPRCAPAWRAATLKSLGVLRLQIVTGGYAQGWHLGEEWRKAGVTATVAAWQRWAPEIMPLPHPSWRNNAFLRRNPWFETELLPVLQRRVRTLINETK